MPAGYQRVLKTSSLELVDPDTGKTVGLLGVVPGRGAALQFKTNDGFTTIKMGPTPEGTSQIRMYNPITGQPAWMLQVATAPGALGYSALNTFYNPDGKPVVQIGTRENGRGYVATDNRDGQLVTHTAPRLRLYG